MASVEDIDQGNGVAKGLGVSVTPLFVTLV